MIVEPLRKKDGSIYTNVELTKICYEKLNNLKNGIGAKTDKERDKMEDTFYRICGGSKNAEEIMAFMKQVVDEPDEDRAQKLIARGLLPLEVIKGGK